jgi:hypothetical protein
MNHQWNYSVRGVTPGNGRPHGVDESWTCERCGAQKSRGPQSTGTGKRVIRWRHDEASERPCAETIAI